MPTAHISGLILAILPNKKITQAWLVVEMGPGTKHPSREPGIGRARNEFILMSKAISQPGMVMHIGT